MAQCINCGSWIPDNQGSKTCSMCYGDPNHGKDNYYNDWLQRQYEEDSSIEDYVENINE